ncbi:MAG: 50S ribosomal protein L22 [bacterium]|nr:50S ribosomal protein L22 [bacterium]
MKTQTARLKYLHIAPRKARLVASSLKGLSVNEAEAQLLISPKRAGEPIIKLLRSAVANAKHNSQLNADNLFIKEIRVDQGPMLKRFLPRAMGRATPLQKKSSHITLVLAESEKLKAPRFKIVKPEKISKKEKIEKIKKETDIEKPKITERDKIKPIEKPGFMKKMFRRKSI